MDTLAIIRFIEVLACTALVAGQQTSLNPDSTPLAADTLFTQTTGQVTHMEPDLHEGRGFLLYSEAKFLKTTNGSTSLLVAGSSSPATNQTDFDSIEGFCQSPSGENIYVADSTRHCIKEVTRVGQGVTTTVGVCGSPGYIDGEGTASRLKRPTACLVDGDSLLIADDGNKVIRSYNLDTQVMETYFELDESSGSIPITALMKDPESNDIYIYAAVASRSKALKIRRGNVGTQQVKALDLVNDDRKPGFFYSTDAVPIRGTLLRMATSGVSQLVRDGEDSCFNVTVQSLGNTASGVSLVMSEGNMFIGRENSITRMNNVDSMFSCTPTPTTRSRITVEYVNVDVSDDSNVNYVGSDLRQPGNLLFTDYDGVWTVNKSSNRGNKMSVDTIADIELRQRFRTFTGIAQLSGDTMVLANEPFRCLRKMDRRFVPSQTNIASNCDAVQIGDQDGVGDQVRLKGPTVIVQDVLQPERLLFADSPIGKIKSLNVTNNAVRTEYTGVGELAALAQNPITGEVYFSSQVVHSQITKIYRLPGNNLNSTAQLVGTLRITQVALTTFQFTNMIFIHNATKLVVFLPASQYAADVEMFDITTSPPRKIECDLGIAGIRYHNKDGAAGLLLDADDTLYLGCRAGIAKIKNFSKVVSLLCPNK